MIIMHHPAFAIFASVTVLIALFNYQKFFSYIAVFIPIAALFLVYAMPMETSADLFKSTVISDGSFYNKLIGAALALALLTANLYSLGQNKKFELILGNAYGAAAFLCLFAGDFLSMFIGVELMMIFSSSIIFIGGKHQSIRSAKKYFITHLISGSMILVGIVHIISKSKSLEIVDVGVLMGNSEYSNVILFIMLIGALINVATPLFSGWMVNYYPNASTCGFIYLISFTTKVSVMVLLKLFSGLFILKYIGAIMILYSATKAIFEDNILSLLCYLSIMAIGLMLMGIGNGSEVAIAAVVCYLFLHIMYKSLLSICAASIIDSTGITECSGFSRGVVSSLSSAASSFKNAKWLMIGVIISTAMMINLPWTSSLYIKSAISHLFLGELMYIIPTFLTLMTVYALPWQIGLKVSQSLTISLDSYTKNSIIFMSFILAFIALFGKKLFSFADITFEKVDLLGFESLKQFFIIIVGLFLSLRYEPKRYNTSPINLIEWLGEIFFQLYSKAFMQNNQSDQDSESWSFDSLEQQIFGKLAAMHNQKTAIFTVFTVFLVVLINLLYNRWSNI